MDEDKENKEKTGTADIAEAVVAQEERIEAQPQKKLPPILKTLQQESKQMSITRVAAIAVVTSLTCSFGSMVVYDKYFAQKVVTVDMKQYLRDQSALYFAGKITKEQLVANFDNLSKLVKAQPKNRIVILQEVVAGGADKLYVQDEDVAHGAEKLSTKEETVTDGAEKLSTK